MYVQSNNISLLRKKGISPEAPQRVSSNGYHTQKNQQQQYTPNGRSYIQQTNLNNRSNIQQPAPNNNYGYGTGYVQNSEPPF